MRGFWQKQLDSFKEKDRQRYFPPFVIAGIYAPPGEKEQVFARLEKAYRACQCKRFFLPSWISFGEECFIKAAGADELAVEGVQILNLP